MLKSAITALGVLAAVAPTRPFTADPGTAGFDAEEVLARTYAAYAALNSYADSGTVVDESKGFRDRFTFRTLQPREPRNFLLDFRYAGADYDNGFKIAGGARTVIWMQAGHLQTWNSETQAHDVYPEDGGRQVEAIKGASVGTRGVSVLVPSLIYIKANLASVVQATEEAVAAGRDDRRPPVPQGDGHRAVALSQRPGHRGAADHDLDRRGDLPHPQSARGHSQGLPTRLAQPPDLHLRAQGEPADRGEALRLHHSGMVK